MSQHQKRDPVDVLHAELLSREGGISAAARAIGRSPGVLHNKFSDAMPHYEISVREALSLAMLSDSTEFVEAVCEQFGGTFLPVQEAAVLMRSACSPTPCTTCPAIAVAATKPTCSCAALPRL